MVPRFGSLAERLARLPPQSRLAFAAACAQRTLPVYEADGYPGADQGIAALRQAIDFIWRSLATSECPSDEGLAVRAAAEAALPSREESSDGGVFLPTTLAGITVLEALDCALAVPSASVGRVAQSSLDAFDAFFEVEGGERLSRHEEQWQEAAVSALETTAAQPPRQELFTELGVPETELVLGEED
jgi:hypothetical protein